MSDADKKLMSAAVNAVDTIDAIYRWIDMIEAEGGATSIAGVAKCNAFLLSMKKNRSRTMELVVKPLRAAVKAQRDGMSR